MRPGGIGEGEFEDCATKYSFAKACEQSMGPSVLIVRCFIVSAGGVSSMLLRET